MILIPVKNLSHAKQRLSAVADQAARTRLAQAMLEDVVHAVVGWKQRPVSALVTSDAFAIDLARSYGLEVIHDPANLSETDAIEMATGVAGEWGAESTLVIPADIPLLQSWELEKIYAEAPPEGSLLVPAADNRGTNAAFRRPYNLFPLRFGNDSFQPHLAAAKTTGKPCIVLPSAGLAVDVDRPEDLKRIVESPGDTRAQRLARQWDLSGVPTRVS
jgi:2-phospho-L-lactate guanylyltransferase